MDVAQQNRNICQFAKDQIIFEERTRAEKIAMLVKGRVVMESAGEKDILYPGSFLGVQDIFAENYLCTYRALEDTILCVFNAETIEKLNESITSNPDYCGLVIASLCKQLGTLSSNFDALYNGAVNAYNSIQQYSSLFETYAYTIKLEKDTITRASNIAMPDRAELDEMLEYYAEMTTFTIDSVRGYFSQGSLIVKHHMREISELFHKLIEHNQKLVTYMAAALDVLVGNNSESIYYKFADLAMLAENRGKSSDQIIKALDHLVDMINEYQNIVESSSNKQVNINRQKMEETYCQILTGSKEEITADEYDGSLSDAEVLQQLSGTLDFILNYGVIEFNLAASFKENIRAFAKLRDRLSIDDHVRTLRRTISDQFYMIYEQVFLRAYHDHAIPLPVQLFLDYGFMDESLLEQEQLLKLYQLSNIKEGGKFKVYTMYEWLCSIYEKKNDPSKNEFDQDYTEWLRSELVSKHISQMEYNERLEDQNQRLHYEINNFFRYTTRIANGRITTFLPVLHKDMFLGNMERFFIGAHKIESALQRIMDVDYSLFYREAAYVNKEAKIEKEYIMMEVLPEIILVPTVGGNGVMWQTISGHQKDTAARFVLPIFTEGNINDIFLKMSARFRWEMCRVAQGSTWNNIKYKSLTSEYLDYIQFYRKNHELSEEKKEKIKSQIQKCNNRTADIFTIDYEAWLKGESQGAVRLNKVARRILAMYCPFEKSIRARIAVQPLFTDPIQAFELERLKKVKEVSNRYKSLQNNQVEITKELANSLDFYQNL